MPVRHLLSERPSLLRLPTPTPTPRYISTSTKKPYQLAVANVQGKLQIKSVGTSAFIMKPNIKAGAGVAHIINNVLIPMNMNQIPKF